MRILVTGAAGFLGARVVSQLLDREHAVRAVVRPGSATLPQEWRGRAEIVSADLENSTTLDQLFNGVDVLVHLAAAMHGTAETQYNATVTSTERLLDAMRATNATPHLVLAGSCSVYDWTAVRATLNEESPLETHLDDRDGYTIAKILQERVTRRFSKENSCTLSVLRPGIIYDDRAVPVASAGLRIGGLFLVIAPFSFLRLTHVENCAQAFVKAAESRVEGTFNIVDDEQISAWHCAGRLMRGNAGGLRIPMPYYAGLAMACMANAASHLLPAAGRRKMPGILNLREYRARFKPLNYDNSRAKMALDWQCKPRFETGWNVT